ncbi:MAG: SAM-dependent methyltransferase, partial [Micrococcales bacterium]|nr:SAM-dependent methyltransferase [Micrococcales bacterium]
WDLERRIELRQGSLLEPVAGESFDLVVSNPPFVITPRTPGEDASSRYTYRDGGREGDALVAELLGDLGSVLAPGGSAHLLGNWEIRAEDVERDGGSLERAWSRRVEGWIPAQLDAWVIQREIESPQAYAETWLRDASEHLEQQRWEKAYAAYLDDFEARGVAGVGFGWVRLDRPAAGRTSPVRRRLEHIGHPAQQPVGGVLAEAVRRELELERLGPAWEELHLEVPEHVTEERHGRPGAEDPAVILVRQGAGLQRTAVLTSAAAGLMGACDGELSVRQIVEALGMLLGWEAPAGQRSQEALDLLAQTRSLLVDGFLEPAAEDAAAEDRAGAVRA